MINYKINKKRKELKKLNKITFLLEYIKNLMKNS